MPTLSPRLVDATSTRAFGIPKPLDPAEYYRLRTAPPTNFCAVKSWDKFDFMVRRNLSRVNAAQFDIKVRNPQDIARTIIEPMLKENDLKAGFVFHDDKLLGLADFALRGDNNGRPLLMLREVTNNTVNMALWSELVDHAQCDITLQQLCGAMFLNGCPFGVVCSASFARFIWIVSSPHGLELRMSDPIAGRDLGIILLSVCLEAVFELPKINSDGLAIAVETLPEPDIQPLSSYEAGISGRIKWWVADQMVKRSFRVYFENHPSCDAGWDLEGLVTVTMNRCQTSEPAVFKIWQGEDVVLRTEASVYEFLASQKPPIMVPRRILYGHLHGGVSLLALEPFGRRMTHKDLNAHVSRQMRRILSSIHSIGLMHCSVSLDRFYIDNSGVVRLADFGRAKLYRRLPDIARKQEIHDLEEALLAK